MDVSVTALYSEDAIAERVEALAEEIARSMPKDMVIVALLKGSFVFAADLIRALHRRGARPQIDFMTLASYGSATESCGAVTVFRDLSESVEGREVLLVDDILESGRSLDFALKSLISRGAKEVRVAVLLEKPGKRKIEVKADFVGFVIPDHFVVGYGLDYAGYWRELPYIGIVPAP